MKKKSIISAIILLLAIGTTESVAQLKNPVIGGFHPDPSVCRVGSDFYLVNSSFQYFPGVPIYHSKDLVNWQQIGNVLDRESQLPLKGASSGGGIFAPTIRYYDGVYYMITTNVSHGWNFMVTATDPRGPWSDPIWLKQGGIDPSLLFDNGKCYMVSNPDGVISLCEIDPATGQQLTPTRELWRGTGGRYPEGPHIYKKDGWYYLLISEGGTELPHMLTIARSRDIYGPYEQNPQNPILTNCRRDGQYCQIQGTGHGDFVEAEDGSWWIVFLGYRRYGGDYHHLGRETLLAPVEWKEGEWPVINGGKPIENTIETALLPAVPMPRPESHTTFRTSRMSPEWVYIQNPITSNYQFFNNRLRLIPHGALSENNQPTFLGRRQECEKISVETEIDTRHVGFGCEAGLSVFQNENGHYDLAVERQMDGEVAVVMKYRVRTLENKVTCKASGDDKIRLRITSDGDNYRFYYSIGEGEYTLLAEHKCLLLSSEVVGGFTGVTIGIYAEGNGYADFTYFDYKEE